MIVTTGCIPVVCFPTSRNGTTDETSVARSNSIKGTFKRQLRFAVEVTHALGCFEGLILFWDALG